MSHTDHSALVRQTLTTATFVEIVDVLVNDFDVIEVLTQLTARCVDLLRVQAAGILLADASGRLCVVGASTDRVQLLELFQLQNDQGPCLDCYTTGKPVAATDLMAPSPWPLFAAESVAAGYSSAYAIPLHHNDAILGCLNLFMSDAVSLEPTDIALAQALADVASIAIVHDHADQRTDDRNDHLVHALDSRMSVELAKGMIAEHFTVEVHEAFAILQSHARSNKRSLTIAANQLVAGTVAIGDVHDERAVDGHFALVVETSVDDRPQRVRIAGELDLASRVACFNGCVGAHGADVELDVSAITFMDCSGFGALVSARLALEHRGGSLSVLNASGQPALLIEMLTDAASADDARPPDPSNQSANAVEGSAAINDVQTVVTRSLRQQISRLARSIRRRPKRPAPDLSHNRQRRLVMQIQPSSVARDARPTPTSDRRTDGPA